MHTYTGNVCAHHRVRFVLRREEEGKQMDKWREADSETYKELHYLERSMKKLKGESIEYEKMAEL